MDQVDGAAEAFGRTFVSLVTWLLTWWVSGQDPGLAVLRQVIGDVWPVVRWAAAAALALGLVAGAALLAVRRRGSDLAHMTTGLARFLLALSAGWLVMASGWRMSEALSRWILAGGTDPRTYRQDLEAALASVEPVLALTLSVAGIAACLALVAAVLLRFVIAVLVMVCLPVVAGLSVARPTPALRHVLIWFAAVLVFRPLAYLVSRVGQELHAGIGDPLVLLVIAVLTFLVSAMILPVTARALSGRF